MATQGTTVQIEMPAMGESVSEGTVLEWLVKVGDSVAVDDPLVEISTDKVDAEVPSTAAGVITKILVEPDETVTVGPGAVRDRGRGEPSAPPAGSNGDSANGDAGEDQGSGEIVDVALPEMGDSVAEGILLEWLVKVGDHVSREQGLAEISTDKIDAELPSPVDGTVVELLAEPDDTVAVGAPLLRIEAGAGAPSGTVSPAADATATKPAAEAPTAPAGNGGANATPVAARMAADKGVDAGRADRHRPARAGDQGRRAERRQRAPPRALRPPPCPRAPRPSPSAAPPPRWPASWTRAGPSPPPPPSAPCRSTALAAQRADLKAAGQEALLHPPDRLGDRPRRRRRHAGDGQRLHRGGRQAPARGARRGEPRHRGRRREQEG